MAHELAAFVRVRAVPDGVPEAPDLVWRVTVDLAEDCLERVKVCVDV